MAETASRPRKPKAERDEPAHAPIGPRDEALQRRAAARQGGYGALINSRPPGPQPVQHPAANRTGLPDRLKAGIETLSGHSLDDVKVHFGSSKPAGIDALAFTQGRDIHLAPGQEQHLPHEAWHVVQQRQGRVKPTLQRKGIAINDDRALELEADLMGSRATGMSPSAATGLQLPPSAAFDGAAPVAQGRLIVLVEAQAAPSKGAATAASSAAAASSSSAAPAADALPTATMHPIPTLTQVLKRAVAGALGAGFFPKPEAWEHLNDLIRDGDEHRATIQQLADQLITEKLVTAKEASASHSVSQHVSNPMPKSASRFSNATTTALPVAKNQEHRRHVIGRHTLGRACDRATDSAADIGAFIVRHKGKALPAAAPLTSLKAEAYRLLQDHQGNLWQGDRGENTAIGFFTGDLYEWFDDVIQDPSKELALKKLGEISSFGYAEKHLKQLKAVIAQLIAQNTLVDLQTKKETVYLTAKFCAVITDFAKSCELDLPPVDMKPAYNVKVIALFDAFAAQNKFFNLNGIADQFMALDLHKEKAPAAAPAAAAKK